MFKVNNRNTRTRYEICFTPCSSVSIVNFEQVNAGMVINYEVPFDNVQRQIVYFIVAIFRNILKKFRKFEAIRNFAQ